MVSGGCGAHPVGGCGTSPSTGESVFRRCGFFGTIGNADLQVGTAARSAARGVYHAAVRMTLNAGVRAERRTTPELGVLPCRPPAAGCADLEVGIPLPARHSARWRGAERRTTPELGVLPCRPPAAGCADLEVGVPWPARHSARWRGAERRTTLNSGSFPAARLRRAVPTWRSAFPGLGVTLHGGVGPRGEPPPKHPERTRTLSPPPP